MLKQESTPEFKLRIIKRSIIILCVLPLLFGLGYWGYVKLHGETNAWMNNEFKPLSIFGTIVGVEKKKDFQTIRIHSGEAILTYGVFTCDDNKGLMDFISVGDSIVKFHNKYAVKIIKEDKRIREFDHFLCP